MLITFGTRSSINRFIVSHLNLIYTLIDLLYLFVVAWLDHSGSLEYYGHTISTSLLAVSMNFNEVCRQPCMMWGLTSSSSSSRTTIAGGWLLVCCNVAPLGTIQLYSNVNGGAIRSLVKQSPLPTTLRLYRNGDEHNTTQTHTGVPLSIGHSSLFQYVQLVHWYIQVNLKEHIDFHSLCRSNVQVQGHIISFWT